jgi:hypothetical protein
VVLKKRLNVGLATAGINEYARECAVVWRRAVEGILSYVAEIEPLPEEVDQKAWQIGRYAEQARPVIFAEAKPLFDRVLAERTKVLLEANFLPSLLDLVQLEPTDETRYSLLLAALLDPSRTGPLAKYFWQELIRCLIELAQKDRSKDEGVLAALKLWNLEMLNRAEVRPQKHNSEWHHLDVFVRIVEKKQYQFGLVFENKIKGRRKERTNQLLDYWKLIRDRPDLGIQRTVFVFLTEEEREMESAGESKSWWLNLTWHHIVAMLLSVAEKDTLSSSHRLLAAQYSDLVIRRIFDDQGLADERQVLNHLTQVLSDRTADDPIWMENFPEIVDLWVKVRRRTA